MTPQLQQAIKLLQMGRLEYLEAIQKELLENPLLEEIRDEGTSGDTGLDLPQAQPESEVAVPVLSGASDNDSDGDAKKGEQPAKRI